MSSNNRMRGTSKCRDCGDTWKGERAGHCTRCCRTFSSDEAFYAHLETFSGTDPSTGFKIYKVIACLDPGELLNKAGDPRFELAINGSGTPSWKALLTAEEQSRLQKLRERR